MRFDLGGGDRYTTKLPHDADVFEAFDARGTRGAVDLLNTVCRCGHRRCDHMAATGALGSFSGTACDLCWTCGTFSP